MTDTKKVIKHEPNCCAPATIKQATDALNGLKPSHYAFYYYSIN